MGFRGGITDAGRTALAAATAGSLQLGIVRIGNASLATHDIDGSITNYVGSLTAERGANTVFYTPFGSDRLVIFTDLRMDAEMDIGNIVFFLDDGTPLAWGAFDRTLKKQAKGSDTGGDWVTLALSLQYDGILELFTLADAQSTEYDMVIQTNETTGQAAIEELSRITTVFDKLTTNLNIPAVAYAGNQWYIDPFFFSMIADFTQISGGAVGDLYDRTPPTFLEQFVPSMTFKATDDGAVYDLYDLTSMFIEIIGETNVSADGQLVGLMLDKRHMGYKTAAAYIPTLTEILSGTWVQGVGSGTIAGSATAVTLTSAADGDRASPAESLVVGNVYRVKITVDVLSAGAIGLYNGATALKTYNATGTYELTFVATATDLRLAAVGTTTGSATVSMKNIPGHHAYAPTDTNRPTFKTASGVNWLNADDTDDFMKITPVLDLGTEWTHVGAWQAASSPANAFALTNTAAKSSLRSASGIWTWRNSSDAAENITAAHGGAIQVLTIKQTDATHLTGRMGGTGDIEITPFDDSAGVKGLAFFSTSNASASGSEPFDGNFYGGIFIDRAITTIEIGHNEAHYADKAGVTL